MMQRKKLLSLAVAGVVGAGSWALAQQQPTTPSNQQSPQANQSSMQGGSSQSTRTGQQSTAADRPGQRVGQSEDRPGQRVGQSQQTTGSQGEQRGNTTLSGQSQTQTGQAQVQTGTRQQGASQQGAYQQDSSQRVTGTQQRTQQRQSGQSQQQQAPDYVAVSVVAIDFPDHLPRGFRLTRETDHDGLRNVLADVTEAALSKGAYEAVVDELVDYDRDRLGTFEPRNDQLDGRIAQLQQAWERKYGEEFSVDEDRVFGRRFRNLQMLTGEITDPIAFAASWPVQPDAQQRGATVGGTGLAQPSAARIGRDAEVNIPRQSDKNIEEGRTVGIVSFPAREDAPPLNVSLIHERLWWDWKVDVPDYINGQQLHDSLLRHLTYIGENEQKWPANKDEAQRMISHHVLMALYGQPVPAYQQDQSSQGQQRQQGQSSQQRQQGQQQQNRPQQQGQGGAY